jgi:hypothetical protein
MKIKVTILIISAVFVSSKSYAQLDTAFISIQKTICIDSIKTVADMWRYGNYELNKYKNNIRTSRYLSKYEEASMQAVRNSIYEMCRTSTNSQNNKNTLTESIIESLFGLIFKYP